MEVSQVVKAAIKGSIAQPEAAGLVIDLLETDIVTAEVLEDYVKKDGSTSQDKINLNTTYTPSSNVNGDIYYDSDSKTIAAKVTDDVTIKINQDETFLAENINSTILKGQVVYVTDSVNSRPRVQLAKADIIAADSILGIALEDIPFGENGLILTKGIISGLDTDEFFTGSTVYLSESTLGGLSALEPSSINFSVAIGYILVSHTINGSIFINLNQFARIADLTDVVISTPTVDQVLRYNGANWINGTEGASSISTGTTLFLDSNPTIPSGSGPQSVEAFTLLRNPSGSSENIITTVVNNSTSLLKYFIYESPIDGTLIDAGNWNFNTYAMVSQSAGTSTLPIVIRKVVTQVGTISISGIGTSRTATANGTTPFSAGDFNSDLTLATYIQTPNALLRITGYISNISVNVETVSTYTNESTVIYQKHTNLFIDTPNELNNTTVALITSETARPSYLINSTDRLAIAYYAKTTSVINTTFSLYINGINNASYVTTPLVARHNNLAGLQGGSSTERYHVTLAQYNVISNTSGINTGDQDLSDYELNTNKVANLSSPDNIKYPTTLAVKNAIDVVAQQTIINALIFG